MTNPEIDFDKLNDAMKDGFSRQDEDDSKFLHKAREIINAMPEKSRLRIAELVGQLLTPEEFRATKQRVKNGTALPEEVCNYSTHCSAMAEINMSIAQCLRETLACLKKRQVN